MNEGPLMLQLDSQTLNDLSRTFDELNKYIGWLIKRKDLEAVDKITPIVNGLGNLLIGIIEGKVRESSPVMDALNRFNDEINRCRAQASTPEEVEEVSTTVEGVLRDFQDRIAELQSEMDRRQKLLTKEREP
jgi:hypothetical protein